MFAYKLSFPCSNNEEEYEALLLEGCQKTWHKEVEGIWGFRVSH